MIKLKSLAMIFPFLIGGSLLSGVPSFAQTAATFTFAPMEIRFAPAGQRATQSFLVTNTGKKPVAIQIRMLKRQMDLDGKETNADADDEFMLYPPQMLVKPGEQQTVRATWVGSSTPSQELAYRIVAEQLPVDLPEIRQNQSGTAVVLKVLFRYVGSVYITPPNVAPKIVLENAACQAGTGKANELVLTFANQGNAHALLSNLKLNLSPMGKEGTSIRLSPEQLKGISGENILPGTKRRFSLACPAGLSNGILAGTFEFNPE